MGEKFVDLPVKNRLEVWLDGRWNTKRGHSNNADVWYDLSGNENHGLSSTGSGQRSLSETSFSHWGRNYLSIDAQNTIIMLGSVNNDLAYRAGNGESTYAFKYTIQIVFEPDFSFYNYMNLWAQGASGGGADGKYYTVVWMDNSTNRTSISLQTDSQGTDTIKYFTNTFSTTPIVNYTVMQNYQKPHRFRRNNVQVLSDSDWWPASTNRPFILGKNNNNPTGTGFPSNNAFRGKIYSVRIFNEFLSDAELDLLHQYDQEVFKI